MIFLCLFFKHFFVHISALICAIGDQKAMFKSQTLVFVVLSFDILLYVVFRRTLWRTLLHRKCDINNPQLNLDKLLQLWILLANGWLTQSPSSVPGGGQAESAEGQQFPFRLARRGGVSPHEPRGEGSPAERSLQRRGLHRGGRSLICQKGSQAALKSTRVLQHLHRQSDTIATEKSYLKWVKTS